MSNFKSLRLAIGVLEGKEERSPVHHLAKAVALFALLISSTTHAG